jgi:hypothetical protein
LLLRSRERKKRENGDTVEKKQLSIDLCYKREQINYKLHLFLIWKTNVKDIQKRISLIIVNSYYICIYKDEVQLSQMLHIIVYV